MSYVDDVRHDIPMFLHRKPDQPTQRAVLSRGQKMLEEIMSPESSAKKFLDEHDALKRQVAELQSAVEVRDDQLRSAGIDLEKMSHKNDFFTREVERIQNNADRYQRIAERALVKLETIGKIMIQGIQDVLEEAKTTNWGDKPRTTPEQTVDDGAAEMARRFAPRMPDNELNR
jgi:uncharacterized protein (DUF3084 family)